MRYPKDQKQATRRRILEAASRRFKEDGIDGTGLAQVTGDAGLTNGAFYAHFASKEDLVANVLADEVRVQREKLNAPPGGRDGLEAFIEMYLSPEHRDHRGEGCPSAALLDEIARRPAATREAFTGEITSYVDAIAARLDGVDRDTARTDALTLFSLMVGTVQLARAVADRELSDQILARGRDAAFSVLRRDRAVPVS